MTRYALENSSACSLQNALVVVKPWTKTNGHPCPEMRTSVSPIVTSRIGITVVAAVTAAFLRLMLQSGHTWRPDPPRAFASLPEIANVCGIPLEIGDRAGLAARARSRLAGAQRISSPLGSPRRALFLEHGTGAGDGTSALGPSRTSRHVRCHVCSWG